MMGEIKLAVRSLARQPSFTIAAVGTLALGIAASTAVFSTVNAAPLQPLPYPDAENIYSLRTAFTDGRYTSGLVGPAELLDLRLVARASTHLLPRRASAINPSRALRTGA